MFSGQKTLKDLTSISISELHFAPYQTGRTSKSHLYEKPKHMEHSAENDDERRKHIIISMNEYEVSFGVAPRNEELLPSDLKTPEPLYSPQILGSVVQNSGSPGIYTQR